MNTHATCLSLQFQNCCAWCVAYIVFIALLTLLIPKKQNKHTEFKYQS